MHFFINFLLLVYNKVNSDYPLLKHPEFSFNAQKFQRQCTIFTKLFKSKFVMFVCVHSTQFSQLPLAVAPTVFLLQLPLQYRIGKFVIMLQYVYPRSFTYQYAVSPRKTHIRTKVKTFFLTLYWLSIRGLLMQTAVSCN